MESSRSDAARKCVTESTPSAVLLGDLQARLRRVSVAIRG
jgi:hypothetical protein